jgi:transposase-like protein
MTICPECGCEHLVKNGRIHNRTQRFLCPMYGYGRQFVENSENKIISQETKDLCHQNADNHCPHTMQQSEKLPLV